MKLFLNAEPAKRPEERLFEYLQSLPKNEEIKVKKGFRNFFNRIWFFAS